LVVRLAEENRSWGYKRISGELKKPGHKACPSYVRDVLRRQGLPPVPNRKGLSWRQFLQPHLEVSWATDFFTEEVWTPSGLVTFYVLLFIHLGSRRVWMAGCAPQPHAAWVAQQGRNFSMAIEDWELPCRYLVHDRDTSFLAWDGVLKTDDRRILKTPPHAPLCNAHAQRHIREIRETLDHLILLGEPHLRRALSELEGHHNGRRPPQGIGNVIPLGFGYPAEPMRQNTQIYLRPESRGSSRPLLHIRPTSWLQTIQTSFRTTQGIPEQGMPRRTPLLATGCATAGVRPPGGRRNLDGRRAAHEPPAVSLPQG
jgi:hypothetical protein